MPKKEIVIIEEFSTGIQVETAPEGGWVSGGFTLGFMNSTMNQIPQTVKTAIENKLFALAEGKGNNLPGIVARVVPGSPEWSVVAVVSGARDNQGRTLSVYRYFLTQGGENLWKIIEWLEVVRSGERGSFPVFDPFLTRTPGRPIKYELDTSIAPLTVNPEAQSWLASQSTPVLLQPDANNNDLRSIYAWAKAKAENRPVSFAYNAQALEKPQQFILIHAASLTAYEEIQKAVSRGPIVRPPDNFDESGLRRAIQGLMEYSAPKPEQVDTVADALDNPAVTTAYWHKVFNDKGADTAIEYNSSTKEIALLLTLRAMVLTETILEFLKWLDRKENRKFRQVVGDFIREFSPGLRSSKPHLLESEFSTRGLIAQNIQQDLELIGNPQRGARLDKTCFQCGDTIWNHLTINWPYFPSSPIIEYKPLAEFFKYLQGYEISIYFYQVSKGIVPKKLWREANLSLKDYKRRVFGLTVRREVTLDERILNFLKEVGKFIVENSTIILITACGLIILRGTFEAGYLRAWVRFTSNSQKNVAGQDFNSEPLESLIKELKEELKAEKDESEIKKTILATLCPQDNCLVETKEGKDSQTLTPLEWNIIIYQYQKRNPGLSADGILGGNTIAKLEEDVKSELGYPPPPVEVP